MRKTEIDARCEEVARATGLRFAWVRYHVEKRAGRPCARCDGTGFVGVGACFRCGGAGGGASHAKVADALAWVEANVERIRRLGERRDERQPVVDAARRHREVLAVQAWKQDHAEMWALVEDMLPSDFKYSMLRAIEELRVTPRQEEALQKLVAANRRCDAPSVGSRVDVVAVITSARSWVNLRGQPVFRVDFKVARGWAGRIEVTDKDLVEAVQSRRADEVRLRGSVVWSKESYAILSERVEMDFRTG